MTTSVETKKLNEMAAAVHSEPLLNQHQIFGRNASARSLPGSPPRSIFDNLHRDPAQSNGQADEFSMKENVNTKNIRYTAGVVDPNLA